MDEKGLDSIRKKVKKTHWYIYIHFVFFTFFEGKITFDWIY